MRRVECKYDDLAPRHSTYLFEAILFVGLMVNRQDRHRRIKGIVVEG